MLDNLDWATVWRFLYPILREGLIALLLAVLALLGYDKYVPSRYARRSGETGTAEAATWARSLRAGGRALDAAADGSSSSTQHKRGGSKA